MIDNESIALRREMLAKWYLNGLRRYERLLQSSRSRWLVAVRSRSYYVTGEQLHSALDATYHELHKALAGHRAWGFDSAGNAAELAVIGLAQRRLQARLVDEIRRDQRSPEIAEVSEDRIFANATADPAESVSPGFVEALGDESAETRAAVLLSGAGYTAPEIASRLGIKPAAARQRLSRFGRRVRAAREAA